MNHHLNPRGLHAPIGQIAYEKVGTEFLLVHIHPDGHREIWYQGPEVAIGFQYAPEDEIQFITHRHGDPTTVGLWVHKMRRAIETAEARTVPRGEWAQPYSIKTDRWELEDLNRIISTTGYLGTVLEKMGVPIPLTGSVVEAGRG